MSAKLYVPLFLALCLTAGESDLLSQDVLGPSTHDVMSCFLPSSRPESLLLPEGCLICSFIHFVSILGYAAVAV